MKSALAGMYPAMSRDSTESNVGRGGSSEAVVSQKQMDTKNMSLQHAEFSQCFARKTTQIIESTEESIDKDIYATSNVFQ